MKHDITYYTELRTYELTWESSFKLGMELTDLQRIIYNPCIIAKQEIISCEHRSVVIKVTESVMDNAIRFMLSFKTEKLLG